MSPEPTEPSELTDLQLSILSVLWDRREATVAEIHEAIGERAGASRKTIATLLDRLERRGYVRHKARDRENVYRATVSRQRVVVSRVGSLLGALFTPKSRAAGARAVDASEVRPGDVEQLLALLRRAERDVRKMERGDE
jgi:BlaI family transcriptional regulator, penicillinase repressor